MVEAAAAKKHFAEAPALTSVLDSAEDEELSLALALSATDAAKKADVIELAERLNCAPPFATSASKVMLKYECRSTSGNLKPLHGKVGDFVGMNKSKKVADVIFPDGPLCSVDVPWGS